nr:hypothetical protein [Cellulosimicrobium sp. MM]
MLDAAVPGACSLADADQIVPAILGADSGAACSRSSRTTRATC